MCVNVRICVCVYIYIYIGLTQNRNLGLTLIALYIRFWLRFVACALWPAPILRSAGVPSIYRRSIYKGDTSLAFTRYCHHQYCMVYGIKRRGW